MAVENNISPFQLAMEFACITSQSIFVTGKAGTGKTTFLKSVRENCKKKLVVLAPTGIAAVNADGITIHSFFQFPFEILNESFFQESMPVYKAEKLKLIQELELLVIDEISMVRADVIDAIDVVLRHYRKKPLVPFGGVQLVLIGDLFQLSPVLSDQAAEELKKLYSAPFFFEAHSIRKLNYLIIELPTVFRQHDDVFIALLNAVRNNNCSEHDLKLLNERCVTEDNLPVEYIYLTTHKLDAENLNKKALNQIHSPLVVLSAKVEGEFPESSDPAPRRLEIKIGARIIFAKNDNSEKKEFFNGKAGIVEQIGDEKIIIRVDGDQLIELERATWINRGARFDSLTGKIQSTELGSFSQFPIQLAWAITIHKSQGMTFEKAVVDATNAFAPGQVYVALSRLRSLEGLLLRKPLSNASIQTDQRIVAFHQRESKNHVTQHYLIVEKIKFRHNLLINLLSFERFSEAIESFKKNYNDMAFASSCENAVSELTKVSEKFNVQLEGMLSAAYLDQYRSTCSRVEQAVNYFIEKITSQLIHPIKEFALTVKDIKKNEQLIVDLNNLFNLFEARKRELSTGLRVANGLMKAMETGELMEMIYTQHQGSQLFELEIKKKESKTNNSNTQIKTLSLFQKGFSVDEIAQKRNLPRGVVEDHLNSFLKSGEISLHQLVSPEKVELIAEMRRQQPGWSVHEIRLALGTGISFGEIRAVLETM